MSHCEQWVTKFTLLLHEVATEEINSLYHYFSSNTASLRVTPSNLDELAQVVNLQKQLDSERKSVQTRFEPLKNMFQTLEKVRCSVAAAFLLACPTFRHPRLQMRICSSLGCCHCIGPGGMSGVGCVWP